MENKQKIYFRADAGLRIGYGHFIRTLALADMLKGEFVCTFFTVEPTAYQKVELERVCDYVVLNEESKFEDFLTFLDGDEIVVLDNYFYTTEYQQSIKSKGCKLVCIDDMHDKHYVADAVINHGVVVESEFDCEPYTRLCLGKKYELLRIPFLQPLRGLKRNNNVVVSFGGSDPLHLTDKVVSLLIELQSPYHIITILGDKSYLSEDNRNKVEIQSNLSAQQMADVFETSAFGILSTSTVCLEAMSRQLPIMIGYYVENQREGYDRFLSRGTFLPLGYLPDLKKEDLLSALSKLKSFEPSKRDYSAIVKNFNQLFHSL